jgi:hypothetical protein
MGDPVFLKSEISFTSENSAMGSVVYKKRGSVKMSFSIKAPIPDSTVRIIVDGGVFIEEKINSADKYNIDFEFCPEFALSFARVELYNPDGRCVMLTNPIYVVDPNTFRGDIPKERLNEGK